MHVNVLHVVMKSKNEITDKSFKMYGCFGFIFFGLISCLIVFSIAPMFDRKPTSVGTAGSGKFELKNECYKEFNPYFYHYCRTDQSQVR